MRIASDPKMAQIVRILNEAKANADVEPELVAVIDKYLANLKNRDEVRKLVPELMKLVEASKVESVKEIKLYERDLVDKSVWIS